MNDEEFEAALRVLGVVTESLPYSRVFRWRGNYVFSVHDLVPGTIMANETIISIIVYRIQLLKI